MLSRHIQRLARGTRVRRLDNGCFLGGVLVCLQGRHAIFSWDNGQLETLRFNQCKRIQPVRRRKTATWMERFYLYHRDLRMYVDLDTFIIAHREWSRAKENVRLSRRTNYGYLPGQILPVAASDVAYTRLGRTMAEIHSSISAKGRV